MKKLIKVNAASRTGEMSSLNTLVLKALAKGDWSEDAFLTAIIVFLTQKGEALIEAIKRTTNYSQLAEKDRRRAKGVKSLFHLVEAYTDSLNEELEQKGAVVKELLDKYGLKVVNESFGEESAQLNSLLEDLQKSDIQPILQALPQVPEAVILLRGAQNDFETTALLQAERETQKAELSSASQLSKEIVTEYNEKLVSYLYTMAQVNPDIYKEIALTIGELIEENNAGVKRRKKGEMMTGEPVQDDTTQNRLLDPNGDKPADDLPNLSDQNEL